ncbi:hypothetical protein [Nonomuraea jabiensis]|uniref:hypothetical protein n=1 Tax=Nonomuraea jabiensis TaxID=882448 RepID=UPI003D74B938
MTMLVRRMAVLVAALPLLISALGPVADATSRTDHVRHAQVACPGKRAFKERCAAWRLWLRSGRVIPLKDARVFQPNSTVLAPLALSPHGSTVAYFRTRDDALVVRDVTTGKVRTVPGVTWQSGDRMQVRLSPGGRFAVIYYGDVYTERSRVVDTVTGQARTFPFSPLHISFSPDNDYVIAYNADNPVGSVVVYSTSTWTEVRRGTQPGALSMGGTTVAYVDQNGGTPYIRLRDVAAGASAGAAIKVPSGEFDRGLAWDQAGHLDLLTVIGKTPSGDIIYRWRRANDGMRILDTFAIDSIRSIPPVGSVMK